MSVFIQKSKTDIYRDGDIIVIARIGNKLCPVKNLEKYLECSNNQTDCDLYLFRNLTKSKDSFTFRKDNKPLSYTRMRELFIEVLSSFVPNMKSFGLHSLRAGGASAACNFGISDVQKAWTMDIGDCERCLCEGLFFPTECWFH
ncbi:Hypothetical predicted protein [Mytilus galloprovincialis]|uniref:Tyr recombinase domain-containing protein n=1 Tax=Mytilus galloprovincialis TaxID=29158 RepID=A0A8B6H2Z7_MYTGA|nr:Hypothetical predicted protein [Mytilus galloprovincialis]